MNTVLSQRQKIIKRLKTGWCTGLEALQCANTMKLATRIGELRRAGYEINDRWQEVNGKRFKAYTLKAKTPSRVNG
jgi:hypothetical protein